MNEYRILKDRQQEEFNNFPLGFAFSKSQFEEMFKKWGLNANSKKDIEKVAHLYAGAYIRKSDVPAYIEMANKHDKELKDAIAADTTGEGFIFQMFLYELDNHEFGYTGDTSDTLDALGYTADEVLNNPLLKRGLEKAVTLIMKREQ